MFHPRSLARQEPIRPNVVTMTTGAHTVTRVTGPASAVFGAAAPRCLVLEPDRAVRDQMVASLGAAGAAVSAAGTLLAARAAMAHALPALVVLGPGVDDEVAGHLRLGGAPGDPARDVVRFTTTAGATGDDGVYPLSGLPLVARAWVSAHRALAPSVRAAQVMSDALLAADDPVLVAEIPPHGGAPRVHAANAAGLALVGVPGTRPGDPGAVLDACRQAVASGHEADVEFRSGARVIACRVVPRDGCAVLVGRDVTATRRDDARRRALARVSDQVAHTAPFAALCRTVCDEIAAFLGTRRVALGRIEGQNVAVFAVNGSAAMTTPGPREAQASALSAAARTGRPARAVFAPGGRVDWDATSRVEEAAVPILVDGRAWGAVMAADDGTGGVAPDAEAFLQSMAHLVAVAVQHDAAHRELVEHARTDRLTGLPNRRSFEERLAAETSRARRHGRVLALAVVDLDHFKAVNDAHGHGVGDEVLREAASRLRAAARAGDLVARVGGEEFGWLMPDTDAAAAVEAVERARRAMAGTPFAGAGTMTMSAGVCDTLHAVDSETLCRDADAALYAAKNTGRNRTARHRPAAASTPHERSQRRADMCARVARALGWGEALARELHRAVGRMEQSAEPGDAHMVWGALADEAWDADASRSIDPAAVLAAVRVWDAPSATTDAERFLRLHVANDGLRPDVVAALIGQRTAPAKGARPAP